MLNLVLWMMFYALILAASQILLKAGLTQIGGFSLKSTRDILPLFIMVITNFYVMSGTVLMGSSFLLWMVMLSWFRLSVIFPMTAMVYVFVALLSYFFLHERLLIQNYFGILLIAVGIIFLLYKHV